ncbi:MAG: quinolinate synthase NadA [bacterium]|nr:quinolinate synthase NadA [bacterium]
MDLIKKIKKLKKDKDAAILVHNYQPEEIQEIADILGDSLDLAKKAAETKHSRIVFCGVHFMAETAKILSPQKTVMLSNMDSGCPMADMVTVEALERLKAKHPEAKCVTYVNSPAAVKAVSDVCCTSANAVNIIRNIDAREIIFSPDKNLGAYCQKFTDKKIILWDGFCYVHAKFTRKEVSAAKHKYPDADLLIHPECNPEVVELADAVLSTSGMIKYVKESNKKIFLIGTEGGLIQRLKRENPDKEFYSAGTLKLCVNMKKTTLQDVYNCLSYNKNEIIMDEEIIKKSEKSLKEMLKYV